MRSNSYYNGNLPQFYAVDQHQGIVSPEDFLLTQKLIAANRGGWEGELPEMHIYTEGAFKGFVSVVPRWCGYASEDYNRASLRAYGVEESELERLGGVIEADPANRGQQIIGKAGQKATENSTFQYYTKIDSDEFQTYPDYDEKMMASEEEEQLSAFAEQVRKRQKELEAIEVDKRSFGPYDLSGCEKVRAELFALNDKVCLTIDKNGIIFNRRSREKMGEDLEFVEIAYNPVLQMMIVHKTEESSRSLKWANEKSMQRCGCKGFSNALFDNMGWSMDYKYKLVGSPTVIDGETVLVFTLDDPIRQVPIKTKKDKQETGKKSKSKAMKELLEAGFAPEDFQVPNSMSDIDLGNDTLNEKAKNAAKSRAIYYDNYTSATGEIHVNDLGAEKYDPEFIRQIIQKNRKPAEGWRYLSGMAMFKKNSFTIMPESLADSFGYEVYSRNPMARIEGSIISGTPYGWTQSLTLPTREIVEETIQMLAAERLEGTCAVA